MSFVAILLVLVVWHVSFRIRTNNAIKRLEAKARANGEPLSLQEVAAIYAAPIPDQDNAAIPLMDLWEEDDPVFWKAYRTQQIPMPRQNPISVPEGLPVVTSPWTRTSRLNPMTAQEAEAAEQFIVERRQHIDRLLLALERRTARFPLRLQDGIAMSVVHAATIKKEASLLRLDALVAARRGDLTEAVRATVGCFRIAEILQDDPALIDQLVRLACEGIGTACIEDLLNQHPLSAPQLVELRLALERSTTSRFPVETMWMERAIFRGLLADLPKAYALAFQSELTEESAESDMSALERRAKLHSRIMEALGLSRADVAYYLNRIDQLTTISSKADPERLEAAIVWQAETDGAVNGYLPRPLSRAMLGTFGRIFSRFTTYAARRQCALTAVAVEQFRRSHEDTVPETLADLVPVYFDSVPADPFDGQSLRFQRRQSGYSIHSVGADLIDDVGKEKVAEGQPSQGGDGISGRSTFDEAFIVER